MKRTTTFLASMLALSFIGTATAAGSAPHPTAVDADGDGAYVATVDVNGDKKLDAADIGVLKNKYDCDDSAAAESPLNKEVYGDGLDNDCNPATNDDLPLSQPERDRFKAAEYGGKWSDAVFAAEHKACAVSPNYCSVDGKNGRFKIKDDPDWSFTDIYVNGTGVFRNHGEPEDGREIVNKAQISNFHGSTGTRSSSSSSGSSGVSKATVIKVVEEKVKKETEDRLFWQTTQEAADAARDGVINQHGDAIADLAKSIEDEAKLRADEDKAIRKELEGVRVVAHAAGDRAADASRDAGKALEEARAGAFYGPLFEAGPVASISLRSPVESENSGELQRGMALGAVGVGLRAGVDGERFEVAGIGSIELGGDGVGTGPDVSVLVGAEALGLVDGYGSHFGGWLAYQHAEDHGTVVDVTVLNHSLLLGAVLNRDFAAGPARATGFVRIGLGPSLSGFRGAVDGETGTLQALSVAGTLQAGFLFGAGARRD